MIPAMNYTQLERKLPADLPPPGQRLRGCLTKVPSAQVSLDILEIGMVEQVEKLKTKLKIQPLRDMRVFVNRHVRLHEGRVAELAGFFVAIRPCGGHGELSGCENTGRVGTTGRSLLIIGNVGEAEVISIGKVVPRCWSDVRIRANHIVCAVI